MDVPPTGPTPTPPPPTTPTPYRDGKALAAIIPPDRRRQKAAALVLSSMVAGIVLWILGGWALEMIRGERVTTKRPTRPLGQVAGRIGPSVLRGPEGTITMPPSRRSVVHVWLQGCSDCMPAFGAMAELQDSGGLGVQVPVVNVAYGEADMSWAQRYGVATNLVFDPGGANVVKPLGISTFTTLVVEPDGSIIHRDRPDRAGYVGRVRAAVLAGNPPHAPHLDPRDPFTSPTPPPATQPLGQEAVQRVVASHTAGIKRTCWERRTVDDGPASASIVVNLTIEADGHVSSTSATGDDRFVATCIENQTRTWLFPAPGSPTTVSIPFKFVRQ